VLHYKIVVACTEALSLQDLIEFFPEHAAEIKPAVDLLLEKQILTKDSNSRLSCTISNRNIAALNPFTKSYTKMFGKLFEELHSTAGEIGLNHRNLTPYIRSALLVEYLTPEQLRTLRADFLTFREKLQKFVHENRSDEISKRRSRKNLVAVVCLMAPINKASFIRNPQFHA
jgi:hypothetical protein